MQVSFSKHAINGDSIEKSPGISVASMKASVISGIAFHADHAIVFPMPLLKEEKSDPEFT